MAFSYRDIKDTMTTVTGDYNPSDGELIYLTLMIKWLGTVLYQLQLQLDMLADKYPFRPYFRLVKADTTAEKFKSDPDGCKLKESYAGSGYINNAGNYRVSEENLLYDFKVAAFIRVSMTGDRLPSNDTSTPYQDIPLVSERFRFQQNAITTNAGDGKTGVLLNDSLNGNFEAKNKTVLTVPFLVRQVIGKLKRGAMTPAVICTGGKGRQKATGIFSYLITNTALLIAGSLSEVPYTLFSFLVGREVLTNNLIAFSNGVARLPQINNNIYSEFIYVPSGLKASTSAVDRIVSEELILRYSVADKPEETTDYTVPNVFVTSEPIQSNYMKVQGKFRDLRTMRIVTPDPEAGGDMDMSGAMCLLCALEAFPTVRKILMFR